MTADPTLIVYSRKDCHLCELAVSMLERAGVGWRLIDIDDDPELARRYGNYVPVLMRPESGDELFFPFSEEQVLKFAENAS